jgi:hypothetical protein
LRTDMSFQLDYDFSNVRIMVLLNLLVKATSHLSVKQLAQKLDFFLAKVWAILESKILRVLRFSKITFEQFKRIEFILNLLDVLEVLQSLIRLKIIDAVYRQLRFRYSFL